MISAHVARMRTDLMHARVCALESRGTYKKIKRTVACVKSCREELNFFLHLLRVRPRMPCLPAPQTCYYGNTIPPCCLLPVASCQLPPMWHIFGIIFILWFFLKNIFEYTQPSWNKTFTVMIIINFILIYKKCVQFYRNVIEIIMR